MFKIKDNIIYKEIKEEGILLQLEDDQYYTVNKLGAIILRKLNTEIHTEDTLQDAIVDLYDKKYEEEIRCDVSEYLMHLQSEDIIFKLNEKR